MKIFTISEEVLSSGSALWFSPKGSKVAVASFNDTEVEIATYFYYGVPGSVEHQYPIVQNLRYPKVKTNKNFNLKFSTNFFSSVGRHKKSRCFIKSHRLERRN